MRRFGPPSLVLVLALLAPASAAAGGSYLGVGIGKEAPLTGELGESFHTDGSHHARLMLGKRFGPLALEGVLFGTQLSRPGVERDLNTLSLGVDARYSFGLTLNLSAYLKGGLHRTWLRASSEEEPLLASASGNGHAIGAGLEYRFPLASIWLDYTRQSFELRSEARPDRTVDGGAKMLTIGVSVGL